jgi:hypothetical protein
MLIQRKSDNRREVALFDKEGATTDESEAGNEARIPVEVMVPLGSNCEFVEGGLGI